MMEKKAFVIRLLMGVFGIIAILVVAPFVERVLISKNMHDTIEDNKIDVGALFYTEIEQDVFIRTLHE